MSDSWRKSSRGAAKECSPRREPWVAEGGTVKPRSGERASLQARFDLLVGTRFFRRSAALKRGYAFSPTAYAVGYILSPLRGCDSLTVQPCRNQEGA
jgi:hypothetical protein